MKKLMYSSLALIMAAFMLVSCSKNTPKDVAYNWLIAYNHLDFEGAKKLSTTDTKNLINSLQRLTENVADSNKKDLKKITVDIKGVKVDGDKAVATYTSSDNPGKEETLHLVKVNDQWLVLFTKVDLMGEVPEGMYDEPANTTDSTGATGALQDTSMSADATRSDTAKH